MALDLQWMRVASAEIVTRPQLPRHGSDRHVAPLGCSRHSFGFGRRSFASAFFIARSNIMSTQEKLMGNWNQLKGKVKQRWGQLTDDELTHVEGNFDQLVGLVQQKTGEGRQQIERTLKDLSSQTGGAFTEATETARQYVDQASEKLR